MMRIFIVIVCFSISNLVDIVPLASEAKTSSILGIGFCLGNLVGHNEIKGKVIINSKIKAELFEYFLRKVSYGACNAPIFIS